jgi:multidrug efflux pump subunit AcrB
VSIAALAQRHSRAAALVAVALVIGGVIAALALPSSIYPPLQFPASPSSSTRARCRRSR